MKTRAVNLGEPVLCTLTCVPSASSYSAYGLPRHGTLGGRTTMIPSLYTIVVLPMFGQMSSYFRATHTHTHTHTHTPCSVTLNKLELISETVSQNASQTLLLRVEGTTV